MNFEEELSMAERHTTSTTAQGITNKKHFKQEMKKKNSRFMGLFRKGVPHGRAVVIGEDGSQVTMKLLLMFFVLLVLRGDRRLKFGCFF